MQQLKLPLLLLFVALTTNAKALKPYTTSDMYLEYNAFVFSIYRLHNNGLLFPLGEVETGNAEISSVKGKDYYSYVFNDFNQVTFYEVRSETEELEKITAEYRTFINKKGKEVSKPIKLFEYEKGNVIRQYSYTYNEFGYLLEKEVIYSSGQIRTEKTVLNEAGQISYTLTISDGKVLYRSIYEYFQGTNKLQSITRFNRKGRMTSKQVFTCDKTGEEITKKSKLSESCSYKEEDREYYTWITEGENKYGKFKFVSKYRVKDSVQVMAVTIRENTDTSYFEMYNPDNGSFQRVNYSNGKRTSVTKSWKENNQLIQVHYYKGELTYKKVQTLDENKNVVESKVFSKKGELESTFSYTYNQEALSQVKRAGKKAKDDLIVTFY